MNRREFAAALGGIAASLVAAHAQQPRPVIGFLHQGSLPPLPLRNAFRKGLAESGVNEGASVMIEDRWADVAKVENRTTLKISRKPMFRRLGRCNAH
jgi:putative ABC transport system substrate-binding protein